MLQVVSAVATTAPKVYDGANKLVYKMTGGKKKDLKALVLGSDTNAPALAAEAMVRSGLDPNRLQGMLVGFGTANAAEIMAHVSAQVVAEANAVSANQTKIGRVAGLSEGDAEDIYCAEIKAAVVALGLTNVDALMRVTSVLNTLTVDKVSTYKRKGAISPALGYR